MMEGTYKKLENYTFGLKQDLSDKQLIDLIRLLIPPAGRDTIAPLGGRCSIAIGDVEGLGSVAVKHYRRGGFVRHFNNKRYLKFGKTRCRTEYEMIKKAERLGVSVPDPIGYAFRGRIVYEGWLFTREIKECRTLADLDWTDMEHLNSVIKNITDQVSLLVDNNILHVDLHPGNILLDSGDRIYFIDFDRSHRYLFSKKSLRNRYIKRWCRAVKKHGLPPEIGNRFIAEFGEGTGA